jgi:16S rRNA (adenine1518-N6/adenine1519-N6)-dimethyltransferase
MSSRPPFGQHFLIDRQAVRRIVAALELRPGEPLLEIGPGRGALTGDLIRAVGQIAAVEVDPRMALGLRQQFAREQLRLYEQDVMDLNPAEVLAALGASPDARLVVAGNLPYAISKRIAQKLIRERARIDRAVLMFQREVAERLTAEPGGKSYAPLTVLARLTYRITRAFDLPPRAFAPRPAVVSTVTRWRRREGRGLSDPQAERLRGVLAACFARRRRTLRNNLRARLGDDRAVDRLLAAAEIDGGLRAEAVPPEGFLRLAAFWNHASLL